MSKPIFDLILEKGNFALLSDKGLSETILYEFSEFPEYDDNVSEDFYFKYYIPDTPYDVFLLFCLVAKRKKDFKELKEEYLEEFKYKIGFICKPKAFIQNERHIGINVPNIPAYKRLIYALSAKHIKLNLYTVPMSRLYEVYRILKAFNHPILPPVEIQPDLKALINDPFINKENTLENLSEISISDIYSIFYDDKIKKEGFTKLKYNTAFDFLLKSPKKYEDRTNLVKFKTVPFGENVFVTARVVSATRTFNGDLSLELCEEKDYAMDHFTLSFYGMGYYKNFLKPNDRIYVELCKIKKDKGYGSKIIPELEFKALPIAPIYNQSPSSKITTKVITNTVQEILMRFNGDNIGKYLSIIKKEETNLWELLRELHFPKSVQSYYDTIDKLAYIELVYLQLLFLDKRKNNEQNKGLPKNPEDIEVLKKAIDELPYKLTNGQNNAIKEIFSKLRTPQQETVLLSGDVGSGKTTVAQIACMYTVLSGYQAVLVGPTEILARQLYDTFIKFIKPIKNKPTIAYLSGNTKAAEKKDILRGVREGTINILVGTHTAFNIEYNNLGLVVIDEQQKFGTKQKEKLLKSRSDGLQPDIISQTATPIPRSTALAFYGDIDLITLSEKPGNRKENKTEWIVENSLDFVQNERHKVWKHILSEIKAGHQIFIVTPAVEENNKNQIASVKQISKLINKQFGNKLKIKEIHGQLAKEKQNKIIEDFRNQKYDVLIASSIIEVGMDVPNATIMLVLDAHNFGASSLHQIRGRVGRSEKQGYCYLVSDKVFGNSKKRLDSLVDSNDGFEIALVDLETRKEGDILGVKQSGAATTMFCNLANHSALLNQAKEEAERIYNSIDKEQALIDAKVFMRKNEVEED